MVYLPELVLLEIFAHFELKTLVKMSSVCRLWKQVVERLKGSSNGLFVYHTRYPSEQRRWLSNNQPIDCRHQLIDQKAFERFLTSASANETKRIYLYHFRGGEIASEETKVRLREFLDNLEELLIEEPREEPREGDHYKTLIDWQFPLDDTDQVLNFSKVKWLFCESATCPSLALDAPQLKQLVCAGSIGHLKFRSSTECIEYLECENARHALHEKRLPNLKHFVAQETPWHLDLNDFPSLVRLELCPSIADRQFVESLLTQKQVLARDKLEITLCGFQDLQVFCTKSGISLHNQNYRTEIIHFNGALLEQLAANYSKFTRPFRWEMIPVLNPRFSNPPNLSDCLTGLNVRHVVLVGYLNGCNKQTIAFLNSLKRLDSLTFLHCHFRRHSYEMFASEFKSFNRIHSLEITNYSGGRLIDWDDHRYEFLLNLKQLRTLRLANAFLPLDTIRKATEHGLSRLLFKCPSMAVHIDTKNSSYFIYIQTQEDIPTEHKFANLEETFVFVQENETTKQALR